MIYVVCIALIILGFICICIFTACYQEVRYVGSCDREEAIQLVLSCLGTALFWGLLLWIYIIGTPTVGTVVEKYFDTNTGNYCVTIKDLDNSFKFTKTISVPDQDFYHLKVGDSIDLNGFLLDIAER